MNGQLDMLQSNNSSRQSIPESQEAENTPARHDLQNVPAPPEQGVLSPFEKEPPVPNSGREEHSASPSTQTMPLASTQIQQVPSVQQGIPTTDCEQRMLVKRGTSPDNSAAPLTLNESDQEASQTPKNRRRTSKPDGNTSEMVYLMLYRTL